MKSAGAQIGEARRSARLTQAELAHAAGTSQPAVNRYERGYAVPSEPTLRRILDACSVTRRPSDALLAHREEVLELLRRHGASEVLVFGSVARGEDDERSDIDLLVDHLDKDAYSWATPRVKESLERLLGFEVDVGEVGNMKERVLVEALKDARPL